MPSAETMLGFQWGARKRGGDGQSWSQLLEVGAGTDGDVQGCQRPIKAWREERGFGATELGRDQTLVSGKMNLKENWSSR